MKSKVAFLAFAAMALASAAPEVNSTNVVVASQPIEVIPSSTQVQAQESFAQIAAIVESSGAEHEAEDDEHEKGSVLRGRMHHQHHHYEIHEEHGPSPAWAHYRAPSFLVRWITRILGVGPPPPSHHRHRYHHLWNHEGPAHEAFSGERRPHRHPRPRHLEMDDEELDDEAPRDWHHHHREGMSEDSDEVLESAIAWEEAEEGAHPRRRPPLDGTPRSGDVRVHRHHFRHGRPPRTLGGRFLHFFHATGQLVEGLVQSLGFQILSTLARIFVFAYIAVKVARKLQQRRQGREGGVRLEEKVIAEKATLPRFIQEQA